MRVAVLLVVASVLAVAELIHERDLNRDFFGVTDDHMTNHVKHCRKIFFRSGYVDTEVTANLRGDVEGESWSTTVWRRMLGRDVTVRKHDETRRTFIVHLRGPVTPAMRASVEETMGVSFGTYVPHHSFFVVATSTAAHAALDHPDVLWVGEHEPHRKLAPEVQKHLDAPRVRSTTVEETVVFVMLSPTVPSRTQEEAASVAAEWETGLSLHGAVVEAVSPNKIVATVNATDGAKSTLRWLSKQPDAHWVEFAPEFKLLNKYASWITQSNVQDRRPVWDKGISGQNMIVGAADSGMDWDNCLFYDPTVPAPGSGHRKVLKYIVAPGNDQTDEVNGHGTHVTGSIVGKAVWPADTALQNEIAQHNGMAPDAKIVFTDIGSSSDGRLNVPRDLETGLFPEPYSLGARVHSNSWGSAQNTYTSSAAEVDAFMKKNDDFLVLVAAGNDGASPGEVTMNIGSPATSKNCLAVGASQTTNAGHIEALTYFDFEERREAAREQGIDDCCSANDRAQQYCCESAIRRMLQTKSDRWREENVASFSSRGPTADGRVKPEIMAPGQQIVSAHSNGNGGTRPHCESGSPRGANSAALLAMAGTSMATPVMAGLAALVQQYFKEGWYPTGSKTTANTRTASGALVRAMLINSAVPLTGEIDVGNNGTWIQLGDIPSIFQGFGRVQLDNVLYFGPTDSAFGLYVDEGAAMQQGETRNYCVETSGTGNVKATLVWTDAAGDPSAEIALVNDLTLFGGTDNNAVVGNWVTKKDRRNNVEQILLERVSGTQKFQVKAENVPGGTQKYALVITGAAVSSVTTAGCDFTFVDNFEDAGADEYFPFGVAVGIGGAVGFVGLLIMLFSAIRKDPTLLARIFQAMAGGG